MKLLKLFFRISGTIILLCVGALTLLFGSSNNSSALDKYKTTEGMVVGIKTFTSPDTYYRPVISYTDSDGKSFTVTPLELNGGPFPSYTIGEKVQISYNLGFPYSAFITSEYRNNEKHDANLRLVFFFTIGLLAFVGIAAIFTHSDKLWFKILMTIAIVICFLVICIYLMLIFVILSF